MGNEAGNEFAAPAVFYQGIVSSSESGRLAVGIRVRPSHAGMVHGYEVGLARWV